MYLHSHCPKGLLIVFCFDPGVLLQDFIGLGRAGSLELGGQALVRDGQDDEGCCVAFETFAYQKMGYHDAYELGPAEVVKITKDGWETLLPAEKEMRVCAFLWTYYGYPNSNYEGINVEVMRNRNGASLARTDKAKGVAQDIDFVSGVPDSGTPHAIGYSNESGIPFARPFIKYTPTWPRSVLGSLYSSRCFSPSSPSRS